MDLPVRDGLVQCDAAQDAVKVAVVERHGINGNIGRGFVHGFGLKHGAIGSTVGHDSHNICVVGASDADMALAVNHLREIGGGFVVVRERRRAGGPRTPDRRADERQELRGGARWRSFHCGRRRNRSARSCRSLSCRSPSCRSLSFRI
jgi:hypothetical protein